MWGGVRRFWRSYSYFSVVPTGLARCFDGPGAKRRAYWQALLRAFSWQRFLTPFDKHLASLGVTMDSTDHRGLANLIRDSIPPEACIILGTLPPSRSVRRRVSTGLGPFVPG